MRSTLLAIGVLLTFCAGAQGLTLGPNSVIRDEQGKRVELPEVMDKMKNKGYKLVAIKGKPDSFILMKKVADESNFEGNSSEFFGRGAQYEAYFGKPAPEFAVTTIDGKKYSLKDLKGKVVVLNFWFTNCKPCIEEMPHLNAAVDRFKDDPNVIFLGIALDKKDDLCSFLANTPFKYQHVSDAMDNGIISTYGVSGYPLNMVIDKEGIVRFSVTGGRVGIKGEDPVIKAMEKVISEQLMK